MCGEQYNYTLALENECRAGDVFCSQDIVNAAKIGFDFVREEIVPVSSGHSASPVYSLWGEREERAKSKRLSKLSRRLPGSNGSLASDNSGNSGASLLSLPSTSSLNEMPDDVMAMAELVDSVSFDVFAYDESDLIDALLAMSFQLGIVETFNVQVATLHRFFAAVCQSYRDTPYHNFHHACDVTHGLYLILRRLDEDNTFEPLHLFALFVAAICHDLEHPGLNNRYMTLTHSDLAIRYNYRSVLEQHHCSCAVRILSHPDSNILASLSLAEVNEFRDIVVSSILATDMAFHGDFVRRVTERLEAMDVSDFKGLSSDDRQLVFSILLKSADISNITRPFPLARRWGEALHQEFLLQGDLERSQSLPLLDFMDRRKKPNLPVSQSGFIRNLGAPLFEVTARLVPRCEDMYRAALDNIENWTALINTTEWDADKGHLVSPGK